ncbi:hypothetical protein NHJ13734_009851 [Beauveria thailandica]
MADEHDIEFESADAGASSTFPRQCSALRKGGFVVLERRPCQIIDIYTTEAVQHHAEVHIIATDIFTGKKFEVTSLPTASMEVPVVNRKEYQLVDISDDNYLSLMDDNGALKNDVQKPDGRVGKMLAELFPTEEENIHLQKDTNVIILTSMGEEVCIDAKEAPKGS